MLNRLCIVKALPAARLRMIASVSMVAEEPRLVGVTSSSSASIANDLHARAGDDRQNRSTLLSIKRTVDQNERPLRGHRYRRGEANAEAPLESFPSVAGALLEARWGASGCTGGGRVLRRAFGAKRHAQHQRDGGVARWSRDLLCDQRDHIYCEIIPTVDGNVPDLHRVLLR